MIKFELNGRPISVDADPDMPLLWAIRDEIGLTGTKFGCGIGACGACTVHIDGTATRSCITYLADVEGLSVTTIEGLDEEGKHPVQEAWRNLRVPDGPDHAGGIAVARHAQPQRRRHRRGDDRQPLPLHDLSPYPPSRARRRHRNGRLRQWLI